MKKLLACAIVACIVLTSCQSKSIISGFTMGMSETAIKSSIKDKLANGELATSNFWKDSIHLVYNWELLDTTIYTTASFNQDGAPFGNLRITEMDITDSSVSKVVSEAYENVNSQILDDETIWAAEKSSTETSISYSTCPFDKFKKVLEYFQSKYGMQDSVTYQITKKAIHPHTVDSVTGLMNITSFATSFVDDTLNTNYHFHSSMSTFLLKRSKLIPASKFIPFPHFNSVTLFEISKTYTTDLENIIAEKKKDLKPSDIIQVPVEYSIKRRELEYSQGDRLVLVLTIKIGGSNNLKTNIESREISSMKGRIVIKDKFGDLLHTVEDIELACKGALVAHKPGLYYAMEYDGMSTFYPVTHNFDLNMNHKSVSTAFTSAVENDRKLEIEFVPDVLLFSDGSILK